MTTLENIKSLCLKEGITISSLEKEMGYSNGSLSKAKSIPSDRILELSKRFGVTMEYLMTGKNNELSVRDKKDIAYDLDNIMAKLDNGEDGPLRYNGNPIDEHSKLLLRNAIELGLTQLKIENKQLYNPNKNKK